MLRNCFKLVNLKGPITKFHDLMIYDTKDMLQNTRHDVTDFTVDGMVRDTKYLISRERNITFP